MSAKPTGSAGAEDVRNERIEFLTELVGQTDRAAVMVGWAAIETSMLAMLNQITLPGRQFGDNEFSASKLRKICFSLGLLSPEEDTRIDRLSKLRNKFAHRYRAMSFSDPDIANEIKQIPLPDHHTVEPGKGESRYRFIAIVLDVWSCLEARRDYLKRFPLVRARFPLPDLKEFFGEDLDVYVRPAKPPFRY